jgi:hypothetical protein
MLAGVLVAGGIVHANGSPAAVLAPAGQLPVVSLRSSGSVDWVCPGPLPAGASTRRSSVVVTNPGQRRASVEVVVSAVKAGSSDAGTRLPPWSTQLSVAPRTQRVVSLRTTGPEQDDAVSVLSTAGAVAVFESVATAPTGTLAVVHKGGKPIRVAATAPEQSPCSTGVAGTSYLAGGSTAGQSDVVVSLYDPTATQAVASIRVSTGSASVEPPELQGVIIKPYSLQVFDLARSVVQQATVAVTATTSVGRIDLGASETVASDSTASTSVSGQALLIGIAAPQQTWVMTPGLSGSDRTVAVDLYDPGSRPASVTMSSSVPGRPLIEVSATVPAGEVRQVGLPAPTATPSSSHTSGSHKSARNPTVPPPVEGAVIVRTAEGVGLVVARVATQRSGAHSETVATVAATAEASDGWVLPVSSGQSATGTAAHSTSSTSGQGTRSTQPLGGALLISNPGPATVEVHVMELSAAAPLSVVRLTTVSVVAGGTSTVTLQLRLTGPPFAGLQVDASSAVVAEADLYARSATGQALAIAPVPLEGIPVIG